MDAGVCRKKLFIGDTITVRYLKGKNRVVQEDFELWRFNVLFGLESILLLFGIIILIGGFKGKSMYYDYSAKKHNKTKLNKQR